jgi:glyoxylase-like metal-dependent hydrolase (beta-lactamase superfamily II)
MHVRRLLSALICTSILAAPLAALADAPKPESVRMYRLDCGNLDFDNLAAFSDTGAFDGQPRKLVASCMLIGHPKGWLLWDTGLPKDLVGTEKRDEGFGVTMRLKKSIVDQLKDIDLTPADITYVAFSHAHFDHTGQANDFANATWIWQKAEKAWATQEKPHMTVNPASFSKYKEAKENVIEGDYDVFGDGTVRIISAPGHTPGHQSLLVSFPDQKWLISGDIYHQTDSREKQLVPTFNTNRADTESSMHRIEQLAKNYNAKLYIQHEKNDIAKLPAFPDYLK